MTAVPAPPAATTTTTTPATPTGEPAPRKGNDQVRLTGTVTSLNPLVVTTPAGTLVAVTASPTATFSLASPIALTGVQAGQRLEAQGTTAADGSFQATSVHVQDPRPPAAHHRQ